MQRLPSASTLPVHRDLKLLYVLSLIVALGMIAEQDLEPWTSLYTNALNYAAMTPTLAAGESAGILNLR